MTTVPRTPQGLPILGFGTWPLAREHCYQSVLMALEAGLRHIDTAQMYGNEAEVGRAVKASGIQRDELYIVTKCDPNATPVDRFMASVERSVDDLGGSVNLLLIHWPPPDSAMDAYIDALAAAHGKGLAKHIGISNFSTVMMRRAVERSPVKLIANQIEFHALLDQSKVKAEAERLGMSVSAYSPLGRGAVLKEPAIQAIAKRHGRPASEIALRWIIQQGVVAIPMTTKRENAESNLRVLDFGLDEADMAAITALTKRNRRLISPASMKGRWD
jgi:diketogulonate reductase-like aldo/keto reductase